MDENKDKKQDAAADLEAEKTEAAQETTETKQDKQKAAQEKQETKQEPAQDNQETKQDKQETEPEENLAQKLKAAIQKAVEAEARAEALALGVKADAVADVIALAKTRVNKETPLKTAIEQVLTAYADFKATPPITTGTKTRGDADNSFDIEKARAVMGLQSKTK